MSDEERIMQLEARVSSLSATVDDLLKLIRLAVPMTDEEYHRFCGHM